MENPFSLLSQDSTEESVELIHFESLVPDTKVKLPEQPFHEEVDRATQKTFFSQLTCSSKYGYFVAASKSGFMCGKTEHLYDKVYAAEKGDSVSLEGCFKVPIKDGGVKFLTLSQDELQLIVGVTNGLLLIYHVSDIVKKREDALPVRSIPTNNEIISIHPNPGAYPDFVGVCVVDEGCKLFQITTGNLACTIPYAISASWSPRGKQIICGNKEGGIRAFDITGTVKDDIPAPQMVEKLEVRALLWIENHVFFVIYGSTESPDAEHYPYIINRKAINDNEKYQPLGEITPIYNSENADNQFYFSLIRNFGPDVKTMIIVANAIASDFAVIGQNANDKWETWSFEEGRIPSLPLSDSNFEDTFPVGITVDFSASKNLPPFDASESDMPVPSMPIFLFLTNEGRICTYHIYCNALAKNSERYSEMVDASDVLSIQPPSDQQTGLSQLSSAAPTQPVAGAFGAALNNTNNVPTFGSLANTKITSFSDMRTNAPSIKPNASAFTTIQTQSPTFGTGGFGSTGSGMAQTSSFASLAKTSTQTKPSATPFGSTSAFGSTAAPTFGSASFGSAQINNKPTFGSTSFGNTQANNKPIFGSTSFGSAQSDNKPIFGNTQANNKPTFGSTAFGSAQRDKKPTFGSTAFGSAEKSTFSSPQQTPFGSFQNSNLGKKPTQQFDLEEDKKDKSVDKNAEESPLAASGFSSLNLGTPSTGSKYATNTKKPASNEDDMSKPKEFSVDSISISEENKNTNQQSTSRYSHDIDHPEIASSLNVSGYIDGSSEDVSEDYLSDERYEEELSEEEQSEEQSEEEQSEEEQSEEEQSEEEQSEEEQSEEEEKSDEEQADEEQADEEQADEEQAGELKEDGLYENYLHSKPTERNSIQEEEIKQRQAEEETRKRQAEEKENQRKTEEGKQRQIEIITQKSEKSEEAVTQQKDNVGATSQIVDYAPEVPGTKFIPKFAQLPNETDEETKPACVLTAENETSKKFESICFETHDTIKATSKVLSEIQRDIDFHHVENPPIKQECFRNSEYIWKRGDLGGVSHYLDSLSELVPKTAKESKKLLEYVQNLLATTNTFVDQAGTIIGLHLEKTDAINVILKRDDLKELNAISISVQYEELLCIANNDIDIFESTIAEYEKRISELKEKTSIMSVPKNPEKKLTTYNLRRIIHNCSSSIKSVKSQIESLEEKLQQARQNSKLYDEDDCAKSTTKSISSEILEDQLQRQSLFSELFSSTRQRTPLVSTCF